MTKRRNLRVLCAGAALAALLASPAWGTTAAFQRSIEDMTQAPLDILAAPIVAGQTIVTNLREIDDTLAVRIAYPLPGFAWNLMVQLGAGVIREMTGVLEFVPGTVLLFTHAEMDPLFDPVEENDALVDFEGIPFYRIKFGINYTTAGY